MDAESQLVVDLPVESTRVGTRVRIIGLLGPVTVVAGVIWAILQPYRITLLHPHAEGFWWLFVQPPLWIMVAGLGFHLFVARPLVEDLDA